MPRSQKLLGAHVRTNFIITTSVDGHLKLWKKQEQGIEFVKHYRASLKGIVAIAASEDGKLFATVSDGGEGRVFDVVNFGMSWPDVRTAYSIYLTGRHDQHLQVRLQAECVPMGPSRWIGADTAGCVGSGQPDNTYL